MRILIAGCGKIGCQLGLGLAAKGHEVFGMRRCIENIPAQIKPIAADLSQPIEHSLLPDKIDQVIYILAASGFNESAYRQAYVDGVRHIKQALGEGNLSRLSAFIFVSSTSVYAQNNAEWVDEKSLTRPKAFNGQIMLEAEQQVQALDSGVCVRFSGIYGPKRNRLINKVKSGQLAASEPEFFTNRIHIRDCVAVLAHLSYLAQQQPELLESVYLASDHSPVSLHNIEKWLADQLGIGADERNYRVPKRNAGSKKISNQRLLNSGYQFLFPDYQSGYGDVLAAQKNIHTGF